MTDEKITELLKHCSDNGSCGECVFDNGNVHCINKLMQHALDLINRQKAEIEKLEAELCEYPVKTVVGNNSMICSKTSEDYDNLIRDISCCQDLEINLRDGHAVSKTHTEAEMTEVSK